jgi:hypothetical protein
MSHSGQSEVGTGESVKTILANDIQSIVAKDGNAILLSQTYESKCEYRVLRIRKKSRLNSRGVRHVVCSDLKSKLMSNIKKFP